MSKNCIYVSFLSESQRLFRKEGDKRLCHLGCFHNGIILIVNRLKSIAKIQRFFLLKKYFFKILILCIFSIAQHFGYSIKKHAKNNFLKDRTRPQFSRDATGITRIVHSIFQSPRIREGYFTSPLGVSWFLSASLSRLSPPVARLS